MRRLTTAASYANPVQLGLDSVLVVIAWWLAFWLRFNLDIPQETQPLVWRTSLGKRLVELGI